ncbi:MAG: hypothetical protein SOX97_08150 [Sutterella sp.]|nr:hypothetical protein [Sutterella sp.]
MRIKPAALSVALALMSASAFAAVTLDGRTLTQEQAWAAARQGAEIYGLTVGVGLNKEHHLFDAKGELTDVARQASIDFNRNILRSHSSF